MTSLVTPKPSFLSTEAWLHIPFKNRTKTPFDDLVNILLTVPWLDIEPGTAPGLSGSGLRERVSMIEASIRQIDGWWSDYHSQFDVGYAPAQDFITFGPRYYEVYRIGLVVVSLYNGAMVKLLGILRKISPHPLDEVRLHEKHWQHSERVLSAAQYVGRIANSHARLQITPPTIAVAMYGATPDQMEKAQQILDQFVAENEKGEPLTVKRVTEAISV